MSCSSYATQPESDRMSSSHGLIDKTYRIDREKSMVIWIGRSLSIRHTGNLAIAEGELSIERGQLTGGRVVIDMSSITNADLQQTDSRSRLIAHLLSEDFFEVSRYPQAEARLNGWSAVPGATPGTPNYLIEADLTIKGITHPVRFGADIVRQGGVLRAHAALDIDRTRWNVTYGSGIFGDARGVKMINDIITLELVLVAV